MASQLRREISLLQLYAGGSTLALVFLSAAAFRQAQTPPARQKFDQYKQDETVTLRYTQNGTERLAGLTVADRPEASIAAAARMNDAATDDARAKIPQELVDSGLVGGKTRMFAGKDQAGTSKVVLSDANAKPRLTLSVARDGAAKIEFLDEAGKVVRSITP